jgi:hypothetical protein
MLEIQNGASDERERFGHLGFALCICFGFRASNFEFPRFGGAMYTRLIILTAVVVAAVCGLGGLGFHAIEKWSQGLEGARLGEFASAGRVTAQAAGGMVADADPIHYHVREEPRIHHLALRVKVNGKDADAAASGPNIPVGEKARFVYTITYSGNNILYSVTIQDPFRPESLISCDGDRTLVSGETLRCTARAAGTAGPYASLVRVVSWDADGRRVMAEDWVHYYGMA